MKVLMERFPYRWCESEDGDRGWIEKYSRTTLRWSNMYECDSPLQLMTAMEDYNYTLWLDPEHIPCYRKRRGDRVVSPHKR